MVVYAFLLNTKKYKKRKIELTYDSIILQVIISHSYSLQMGQEQAANGLAVLNNTYELNENPTHDTLQDNSENNISIVIDTVTSTNDKKHTNDDHTLNFFLNNVESTISEKEMKLHPKLNLKKSQLVTDYTKDAVLCGFLKSFESADKSSSSNKESTDNITEESNTRL